MLSRQGPDADPLGIPILTEYYTGTWVTNTADTCTLANMANTPSFNFVQLVNQVPTTVASGVATASTAGTIKPFAAAAPAVTPATTINNLITGAGSTVTAPNYPPTVLSPFRVPVWMPSTTATSNCTGTPPIGCTGPSSINTTNGHLILSAPTAPPPGYNQARYVDVMIDLTQPLTLTTANKLIHGNPAAPGYTTNALSYLGNNWHGAVPTGVFTTNSSDWPVSRAALPPGVDLFNDNPTARAIFAPNSPLIYQR
jgi:hypothetical protein